MLGAGVAEAIRRAEEYRGAGADAILVHSKRSDVTEIREFAVEWSNRLPLVIVPTSYHRTPTSVFDELGISVVIWANHVMRAAVSAMEHVARMIHHERSVVNAEQKVAPLSRVFDLQDVDELIAAESSYLPRNAG